MPYNEGLILGFAPQIQYDHFVGRMTELSHLQEWLNAKDEPSLKSRLAQAHSAISESKHADLIAAGEQINLFRRWLSEAETNRWLLIFDNYDDRKQAAAVKQPLLRCSISETTFRIEIMATS